MIIKSNKGCFGTKFTVNGEEFLPICDEYFFEEILSYIGEEKSFKEDKCDQCGDWNHTAKYKVGKKKWKYIKKLFEDV